MDTVVRLEYFLRLDTTLPTGINALCQRVRANSVVSLLQLFKYKVEMTRE